MSDTVVLVPTGGPPDPWRHRLWSWCAYRWGHDFPDFDLTVGASPPGPFNRSAALNAAARHADDWTVAIVADADTTLEPDQIREAVTRARRDGSAVLAYDRFHSLNRKGTEKILDGYAGSWSRFTRWTREGTVSSCLAVARPLWDQVGGFDERFVGWGFEDRAFAISCRLAASLDRVPGDAWHLWHPRSPEKDQRSPEYRANSALVARYREASSFAELEELRR